MNNICFSSNQTNNHNYVLVTTDRRSDIMDTKGHKMSKVEILSNIKSCV